jgi:hypothetical protein
MPINNIKLAEKYLNMSGEIPKLSRIKVIRLPATAKVTLIPTASKMRPVREACMAELATAGIMGKTQGDSRLRIPAIKARGMDDISITWHSQHLSVL